MAAPSSPRDAKLDADLQALTLSPEEPEEGKVRTRRFVLIIAGASVFALIALIAVISAVRSGPVTVHLAEATPKTRWAQAITLIATGHIEPEKRVFVASPSAGRVKKIAVVAGQAVAKGDLVAELDPAFLEAALAEQKAALGAAKAKLKAAHRKLAQERTRAKRERQGADQGGVAQANVSAALAEKKAVDAKIANLKLGLSHTKLRAMMAGRVSKVVASEGQSLAEGALQIAEIVDTSSLFIDADVAEAKLGLLSLGMPADVTLDAFSDRHFDAVLVELRPEVNKQTSTAGVRLKLQNPSADVLLSMAARVSFLSRPVDAAQRNAEAKLTVPADAVTEREGKKVVFVYQGGAVQPAAVLIGANAGPDTEIIGGLKAQDRVVVAPPQSLAAGDQVDVGR